VGVLSDDGDSKREKRKNGATTNRSVKFSHLVEKQEIFEKETFLVGVTSKLLVSCCSIFDITKQYVCVILYFVETKIFIVTN